MGYKESKRISSFYIFLLALFFRIYFLTIRKKIIYSQELKDKMSEGSSILVGLWHQDVIALLHFVTFQKSVNMTSVGKDGQLIAQFSEYFGSEAVRGSTSNNSIQALKGFLRALRKEKVWATIAVDGPRGPKLKAKPGLLEASRITGKPIFSAGVAYSSTWTLKKTWDQTILPKPFSKVVYYIGPALKPVRRDQNTKDPELLLSFEKSMSRNQEKALSLLKQ